LQACLKKNNDISLSIDYQSLFNEVIECSDNQFQTFRSKAIELTRNYFSNQRRLFNPIYISNVCVNDCLYCGFRKSNKLPTRRTLTPAQSLKEATYLISRGVKNLLILAGDYKSERYFEMLLEHIRAIKKIIPSWLAIEVAPLEIKQYQLISSLKVDSVVIFQETYDQQMYQYLHGVNTPKSDFYFRYNAPERAITGGIREIGLGILYGLGDWYNDTLAMIEHAYRLIKYNNEVKLRFSFPRIQISSNQNSNIIKENVTEKILIRIIVAIRLLFPMSRTVLTARESQKFRLENLDIITDIGEGGSTVVGGYTIYSDMMENGQFNLQGRCSLNEFLLKMKSLNYIYF